MKTYHLHANTAAYLDSSQGRAYMAKVNRQPAWRSLVSESPVMESRLRPEIAKTEKRCSHCKQAKPITEFYIASESPDGRQYTCKACARESCKHSRRRMRAREREMKAVAA